VDQKNFLRFFYCNYFKDDRVKIANEFEHLTSAPFDKILSIALNGKNCDEPPKIDQKMAGHLLIEQGKRLKKMVNEDMQVINMMELRKRYKKFIQQFV
jgi:hypothetical protein